MTVQRLQAHYGFTRMPFGRNLAPGMLHRYTGHGEAVARITWCVDQHALGVITGEVGAGNTVAVRAATAALDTSRHVVIYLPNPSDKGRSATDPGTAPSSSSERPVDNGRTKEVMKPVDREEVEYGTFISVVGGMGLAEQGKAGTTLVVEKSDSTVVGRESRARALPRERT